MEKLPFHVGLHLSPELSSHRHTQELPSGTTWHVDLGPANVALFRQLVQGMFATVVELSASEGGPDVAAVLEPTISQYQFSTPDESKTDYYEAWIQYRMRVFSPDGQLVAEWPFTGYGRSRGGLLGASDSLDEATQRAMRDAAALVVLDLGRQPAVRSLLYGGATASRSQDDVSE